MMAEVRPGPEMRARRLRIATADDNIIEGKGVEKFLDASLIEESEA